MPVAAQATIADRYRLAELIATGGMGEVWRAVDVVLDRRVALKLLRSEYADSEEFRTRFRGEARAAASVSHPNVVEVFDYGEQAVDGGGCAAYLVMEFIDGHSVAELIRSARGLSPRETVDLLAQAAAGLQAAHDRGLVHRDIKPANLLRTREGGTIKVADFGIARAADAVPLTRTGTIIGTAQYISPEQGQGRPATAASDLYSLGVVAYACLTGQPPFVDGPDVAVAMAHTTSPPPPLPAFVPDGLRDLVMSLLAKDPADRPESARAVADAAVAMPADPTPVPAAPDSLALDESATGAMPAAAAVGGSTLVYPVAAAVPMAQPVDGARSGFGDPTAPTPDPAAADGPSPRRRRRLVVAACAGALLVGGGGLAAALAGGGDGSVSTPDLHGRQLHAARHALRLDGLRLTVHRVDAPGKSAGTVIGQSPQAGTAVDHGASVRLRIATGTVAVSAARLVGESYASATATLAHLGVTPQRVDQPSTSTTGTVLAVTPTGEVRVGSSVTVTVAAPLPVTPSKPKPKPGPPSAPPGHVKHGFGGWRGHNGDD